MHRDWQQPAARTAARIFPPSTLCPLHSLTDASRRLNVASNARNRCDAAWVLAMNAQAPKLKASSITSMSDCAVRKMTLGAGTSALIRRAASRPLRLGRPISIRTTSGFSNRALSTAFSPSSASPMTWYLKSLLTRDAINSRYAAKSSTTKMRATGDIIIRELQVTHHKVRLPQPPDRSRQILILTFWPAHTRTVVAQGQGTGLATSEGLTVERGTSRIALACLAFACTRH